MRDALRSSFFWIVIAGSWSLLLLQGCQIDGRDEPLGTSETGPTAYIIPVPSNLPPITIPPDNATTVEGVALGRKLFYEELLSADNSQSCATCHAQAFGFSDHGLRFSVGIDGVAGDKNAMAIQNLAWSGDFFWDGRVTGIENQARQPVINPIEMHDNWPNVVAKLQATAAYPKLFEEAFGTTTITEDLVVKAIAQFERTMIAGESDYDKFQRGEANGMTQSAYRGMNLFFSERADCWHCHVIDLLTDYDFHNNGLDSVFTSANIGRAAVTNRASDTGKFKTPGLRNVVYTAPYMHDGRFATLREVIEHYNSGIRHSPTLDPLILHPNGLFLTEQEKIDLEEFLKALTDDTFIGNPAFSDPG